MDKSIIAGRVERPGHYSETLAQTSSYLLSTCDAVRAWMIYNLFLIRSVGHANQMLINCGIFHYDILRLSKVSQVGVAKLERDT